MVMSLLSFWLCIVLSFWLCKSRSVNTLVTQDGFTNLDVSFPRGLALAPSRRSKLKKVWVQHAPWLEGFFVTPFM